MLALPSARGTFSIVELCARFCANHARTALAVCWLLLPLFAGAEPPVSPPEMLNDAELTDVTFLDPDTGWAVGDRGVIWHTVDGGRHWQRQDSHTTCRLEQVCFLNANLGWAVGGWHAPYALRRPTAWPRDAGA